MDKEYNILDKFFSLREEELAGEIETDTKYLKSMLKNVRQEDIVKKIKLLPDEYNNVKIDILNKIDDLIGNYNIKIAYYNKKYYKQGFIDAIDLCNTCKY